MSGNAFENKAVSAINEASRGDVGASSPALDIRTYAGGPTMPVDGKYTDSESVFKQYEFAGGGS